MKIAVDLRPLQSPTRQRGIGYFTYNLNKALLTQKPKFDFLFIKSPTHKIAFKLPYRKQDSYLNVPTTFWPKRGIRRFDPIMKPFWQVALKKSKPDVLHISSLFEVYYLDTPKNIKTIVTLHDIIPYVYKDIYFKNELAFAWYKSRLDQIKNMEKIITISESAKSDLINYLKIPASKIEVIYGGVNENFKPIGQKKSRDFLAKKYQIQVPYLVSVGAFSFHKNLDRIFEAFKIYLEKSGDSKMQLVVVCKLIKIEEDLLNQKIEKQGLKGKVILTNFIPDADMPYIYSGAEALIFPSLYEGFGLPILEAESCGCPVITSITSSMPEVAGKAAILVDPLKVEDISAAILKITNKKLANQLIKLGFSNVKRFSWEKSAKQLIKIYQELER